MNALAIAFLISIVGTFLIILSNNYVVVKRCESRYYSDASYVSDWRCGLPMNHKGKCLPKWKIV
jgi:hypothetical protein